MGKTKGKIGKSNLKAAGLTLTAIISAGTVFGVTGTNIMAADDVAAVETNKNTDTAGRSGETEDKKQLASVLLDHAGFYKNGFEYDSIFLNESVTFSVVFDSELNNVKTINAEITDDNGKKINCSMEPEKEKTFCDYEVEGLDPGTYTLNKIEIEYDDGGKSIYEKKDFDFNVPEITVKEQKMTQIKSISFDKSEVAPGEQLQVDLDLEMDEKVNWKNIYVYMENENGEKGLIQLSSENGNVFLLSDDWQAGSYSIKQIYIEDDNGMNYYYVDNGEYLPVYDWYTDEAAGLSEPVLIVKGPLIEPVLKLNQTEGGTIRLGNEKPVIYTSGNAEFEVVAEPDEGWYIKEWILKNCEESEKAYYTNKVIVNHYDVRNENDHTEYLYPEGCEVSVVFEKRQPGKYLVLGNGTNREVAAGEPVTITVSDYYDVSICTVDSATDLTKELLPEDFSGSGEVTFTMPEYDIWISYHRVLSEAGSGEMVKSANDNITENNGENVPEGTEEDGSSVNVSNTENEEKLIVKESDTVNAEKASARTANVSVGNRASVIQPSSSVVSMAGGSSSVKQVTGAAPATGDHSNNLLWIGLAAGSLAAVIGVIAKRFKKEEE